MNTTARIDRVIELLNRSLDLLARHAQGSIEPSLENLAFGHLVDARDEARTLRAQSVCGAGNGTG